MAGNPMWEFIDGEKNATRRCRPQKYLGAEGEGIEKKTRKEDDCV
jgi:hypothetical protein